MLQLLLRPENTTQKYLIRSQVTKGMESPFTWYHVTEDNPERNGEGG